MNIKVKTTYAGRLPIRSVYVDVAIMTKQNINVTYRGKVYTLTPEVLDRPDAKLAVEDKFSPKSQILYYYDMPKDFTNAKQKKLL